LGLIVEVQATGIANQRDSRRCDYRLHGKGKLLLETELSRVDSIVRLATRKKICTEAGGVTPWNRWFTQAAGFTDAC
jgi:hypothetical protein